MFERWMLHVDSIMASGFGMESANLPDCRYVAWFHAGLSPLQAAHRAIRAANGDEE